MFKLKKYVFTVLAITLLICSFLVFKPTKIYSEGLVNNEGSNNLVSYTIGSEVTKYTISGYVKDKKTEDPLKKVKVILNKPSGLSSSTETNSKGYFEFESLFEGDHILKIENEGYNDYEKSVLIKDKDVELDIFLGFKTVSGYITDKTTGDPMKNTKLTLRKSKKISLETESNNEGYFEFEHVVQGIHTLEIKKEGYSEYNKNVKVDSNNIELSISLNSEKPCTVTGYVIDEKTGKPIKNTTVKLINPNSTTKWILGKTDSKGYFKLEDVTEGSYTLRIEEAGYKDYIQGLLAEGLDQELDIKLKQGVSSSINIEISNIKVEFSDSTGYPFIDENNRTLVPLRKTLESYGAKVEWNNDKKLVSVIKNNNTVYIPTNESYIIINDEKVPNDSKAIIKNERMYCPVRAIIEGLGGTLTWDEETQTVIIKEKEEI